MINSVDWDIFSFIMILILSLSHLTIGKVKILNQYQHFLISVAGGISISYVFLTIFPKLAKAQQLLLSSDDSGILLFFEYNSYLLALIGLLIFFFSDQLVNKLLLLPKRPQLKPYVKFVIYMHASFMAGYYLLTGFIITEMEDVGPFSIILLTIAMIFHFQSMDFIIYKRYHAVYEKFVRWIFAFATLTGWIIAETTEANQLILALFSSFFAGILIIITIKEKIPDREKKIPILPFILGAILYSLVIYFIQF